MASPATSCGKPSNAWIALGLIHIHQGSGVYTKDMLLTGGLELFEYLIFDEQGRLDSKALKEFLTFWTLFVPDVFRLAACNRTEDDIREARTALELRAQSLDNLNRFIEVHQQLLRAVARATHNNVYQLVFNNLGRVMLRFRMTVPLEELAPLTTQEDLHHLLDAVAARDEELAALLARRHTELGREGLERFLQTLPKEVIRHP